MRPRTLLLFALIALLGAAAAVPTASANASELKLEVNQNCVDPEWACWTTEGSALKPQPALKVKIAAGDEIKFIDHDASKAAAVVWTNPAPPCTGVPTSATMNWEGTCTFATSGLYKFESSTLFEEKQSLYGNGSNIDYKNYEVTVTGTPTDATTSASDETQTEAMLNGSIDPEGNAAVAYHFEYEGPGVTGKQSTPIATLSAADFTTDSVSAQVSSLQPGMTYHFVLVATYGGKAVTGATTQTFTTHTVAAPTATTLAAEGLDETETTLKGTVNPGGEATEYFFEYGAGTSYGQTTEKATVSASGGNQGVSAPLKGLTPGTEYHFRLVAKNKRGSAEGLDHSFKTMSTPTKEPPAKEPSPTPTPTGGNTTATTSSPPSSEQAKSEPPSSPLFGSIKLASTQHGGVVHGSLVVSSVGSKGQLQIELLAKGAAAPIGKLVRSSLHAGKLTFVLALSAKGKAALHRHRRLTLTVKIMLAPQHGAATTITRTVILHA